MDILNIENLKVKYGEFTAVENYSLTVKSGEICALDEADGNSVKIILLAAAGALPYEAESAGEITFDGMSLKGKPVECKLEMAYVAEEADLYGFMSGMMYINFIAEMYEVPRKEKSERIHRYSEKLGLEELTRPYDEYSHEEKKLITFAAALIHEPKLIVADKPFDGLGTEAECKLKQVLKEYADNGGTVLCSDMR